MRFMWGLFLGSGENEYLLNERNSRYTTDFDVAFTRTGTSQSISDEAATATTSTATSTKSAETTITSGMEIVSGRNSTRGRRKVTEENYNIVDLDVASPQLKILEEDFGEFYSLETLFTSLLKLKNPF